MLSSKETRLHQPKIKNICGYLSSPRSEADGRIIHTNRLSTLTNALRGIQNNSAFLPIVDRQEKKMLFPINSSVRKTMKHCYSKFFLIGVCRRSQVQDTQKA